MPSVGLDQKLNEAAALHPTTRVPPPAAQQLVVDVFYRTAVCRTATPAANILSSYCRLRPRSQREAACDQEFHPVELLPTSCLPAFPLPHATMFGDFYFFSSHQIASIFYSTQAPRLVSLSL